VLGGATDQPGARALPGRMEWTEREAPDKRHRESRSESAHLITS
jgi:hypothetical protein